MFSRLYLLLFLLPLCSMGQVPVATSIDTSLTDSLRVSLLTAAPGHQLYRIYGHTGVRIENAHKPQEDWAYNYGWFSFDQPGFVARFIFGRTAYTMAQQSTAMFLSTHMRDDMAVTQQSLNLSTEQVKRVKQLLEAPLYDSGFDREEFAVPNLTGGNDTLLLLTPHWIYRYDFLYDNCTTRAVGAIVKAIEESGEQVVYPTLASSTQQLTQRGMIHEFTTASPWYELGQDLLLGAHVDKQHSIQEMTQLNFLPTYAQNFFQQAQIRDKDGHLRPLVIETRPLFPLVAQSQQPALPFSPTVAFLALLLFAAGLTFGEWKSYKASLAAQRAWRIWGLSFDSLLYGVLGGIGLLLLVMVLWSEYLAVRPNYLLLLFNPLLLLLLPYRYWTAQHGKRYWAAPLVWGALCFLLLVGLFGWQSLPLATYPIMGILTLRSDLARYLHLRYSPSQSSTLTPQPTLPQ